MVGVLVAPGESSPHALWGPAFEPPRGGATGGRPSNSTLPTTEYSEGATVLVVVILVVRVVVTMPPKPPPSAD